MAQVVEAEVLDVGPAYCLHVGTLDRRYLRTLLIHGARSLNRWIEGKDDPRSRWLQALVARRGKNKAAVALANKNARIIWALLSRGECNQPTG